MSPTALVTGGSGQDGWYLIELLLSRGYVVHAHSRSAVGLGTHRAGVHWHHGTLTDPDYVYQLLRLITPDEIFNLAAISRPAVSWDTPLQTTQLNAVLPQIFCDLIARHYPNCRFFQASSSEIFGDNQIEAQNENTLLKPQTPYGISKTFAHHTIAAYRERYKLHLSSGIMFNHESPRRPLTFVSQKIAHAVAAISLGIDTTTELDERGKPIVDRGRLLLGDLTVRRDFGFAGDFAEAIHLMIRSDTADDFVIGTGESHSIAEFCERAFRAANLNWDDHVAVDPNLIRTADSHFTRADISKITTKLGWQPRVGFDNLVKMMVESRVKHLSEKLR